LPDRIAAYQRDLDATPISAMLARPPNRSREPVAPERVLLDARLALTETQHDSS
jgi:hypothetical protein